MTTVAEYHEALEARGCNPRTNGDASLVKAKCPAHNGKDHNLSVFTGDDGLAHVKCHSRDCSPKAIRDALHIEEPAKAKTKTKQKSTQSKARRAPDHVYDYRDATGTVVAKIVRWDQRSGKDKIILPRNMQGETKGLPPGQKYPIYNLPDLLARPDAPVLIVEGEKVVQVAATVLSGAVIVTSAGGSNRAAKTDWSPLAGRDCTLWPDADTAGAEYAEDVARLVPGLRVVDISDLPKGWDLADPLPEGFDVNARLKAAAPIEVKPGGLIPEGKTRDGLARALGVMGIDARWNLRGQRSEHQIDGVWCVADDRLIAHIRAEILLRFHYERGADSGRAALHFGRDAYSDLLDAIVFHRQVDPFLEWVEGLPVWDGVPRIDHILTECFGADDSPLTQWASRYIGIGALQRTFEPGCKLDQIPVLIGDQGIGKSAFIAGWLPPDRPDWFGDALDLSARTKEQEEQLAGRTVVELSEMAGLRKGDLEALKAFIVRSNDGQNRAAYARVATVKLRRCIFYGSSNDFEVLPNDSSGNRRFVPIVLTTGCAFEPLAEANRGQWWAEALHLYREGIRANLPRELLAEAAVAAEVHRRADALEADVRATLEADKIMSTTIANLAEQMGILSPDMLMQKRLAQALGANGWKRVQKTVGGTRERVWVPS